MRDFVYLLFKLIYICYIIYLQSKYGMVTCMQTMHLASTIAPMPNPSRLLGLSGSSRPPIYY